MILGETYRKLREEKGISISSLAGYEISKSQISRFELGETEISVFKLFYLLEKIGITFDEFLLACNNYEEPEFFRLIKSIQQSAYTKDVQTLTNAMAHENKLFEEVGSLYHKLNVIFIKSIISGIDQNYQLSQDDFTYLSNYLFSIENWGYYEILILGNCCRSLPPKLLFRYTQEALRKGGVYASIQRNKQALIQLLLNALIIMIENQLYEESLFLQKKSQKLLHHSTHFFELTILMYLEGYFDLTFQTQDNNMAKSKIEDALHIFCHFNDAIYQNYKEYFDKYIINLL